MSAQLRMPLARGDSAYSEARGRAIFVVLLTAFLVYAGIFIYRTSFLIGGERHFSLFDDAMVSMRYARNFAHGYGLIWNPGGERVEGYTNLLWVLYMAAVHLLPLAPSKTSLVVQITAAIFLAWNLYYVRRIALALSNGSQVIAAGAVVVTATYLPLNNWSLQGFEVGALVLLTSVCEWIAIECLDSGTFPHSMYLLLGIGTLIRPDIVVLFVALSGFMLLADRARWRTHLRWGVMVLAAACGLQTLFRLWYYGDILPNTYYLKVTGVALTIRIAHGAYVLMQFIWKANVLMFTLPFTLALRRDRRIWLLLWIFVAQMAYSVYVGGDAWESWGGSNRYISIAMPGFFVLLAYALYLWTSAFVTTLRADRPLLGIDGHATGWIFALAVALAVVSANSIYGAGALAEALLIRPPLHTGTGGENQQDVEQALGLRQLTTADATVAVMRAGTIPYFAERGAVDLLGKSDRHIAHEPANSASGADNFREFRPGHVKFDFAYSIGDLRPDVVLQLRRREPLARPFLQDYEDALLDGECVYVRRGSRNVRRDRLTRLGCHE